MQPVPPLKNAPVAAPRAEALPAILIPQKPQRQPALRKATPHIPAPLAVIVTKITTRMLHTPLKTTSVPLAEALIKVIVMNI